jgi:hypothetical protein
MPVNKTTPNAVDWGSATAVPASPPRKSGTSERSGVGRLPAEDSSMGMDSGEGESILDFTSASLDKLVRCGHIFRENLIMIFPIVFALQPNSKQLFLKILTIEWD